MPLIILEYIFIQAPSVKEQNFELRTEADPTHSGSDCIFPETKNTTSKLTPKMGFSRESRKFLT